MVNMLIRAILCYFAAAISCSVHGWKPGQIYKYDYKVCFRVDNGSDITVGNFKADLHIRPLSNDKWSVTMQNPQERKVDSNEPQSCETFSLDAPGFRNESISDEPFEISWKNGIITALAAEQNAKEEDLVRIKTIASHLQLDLQGENCNESKPCRLPTETRPNAVYQTVENTTAGACPTLYKVSRFLEFNSPLRTESDEKKPLFKVVKTSDYMKCSHCSTDGIGKSEKDKFVSLNSTNHVVFSGNMNEYIIQSLNSTLEGIGLPKSPFLPSPTIVWVANLTLASSYPAQGHPRNVLNPQKINLETWC